MIVPCGIARCASSVGQDGVPERGFLRRLDLGEIEGDGSAGVPQGLVVVHHVEHGVDDRRREAGAAFVAHVPVVEVEATGPEDPRGEVQLPPPVLDDRPAEELPRPGVHLAGNLFGDLQEQRGAGESRASGSAGCRATSSTPGRARPRRRTSSRRRPTAARRRRCGCSSPPGRPASPPAPCPGSTAAADRRESRCRRTARRGHPRP